MNKQILLISIFIFAFVVSNYGQSNSWKGLTPLRSTRADVEKMFGEGKKSVYDFYFDYKKADEAITVCYAPERCASGWDVPKDTVLSIEIFQISYTEKHFDDLKLDESKFSYTADDIFDSTWTNAEEGLQYEFDLYRWLRSIRYIPKKSDNDLRCNGFPPYTPEGHHPQYFRSALFYHPKLSKKKSLYEVFYKLDNFIISVQNNTNDGKYLGYVLIYFDNKLPFKEYEKRLRRVKNHIFNFRKVSPEKITVIEGGMREESQIEFYLLPKVMKPPAPEPTLPSPQFMKKQ